MTGRRAALLVGLAALAWTALGLVAYDLITNPRDIWAALCFGAGAFAGAAHDRWRKHDR